MPVFDFKNAPEDVKEAECTYTTFASNERVADEKHPILILDNSQMKWEHHSIGHFASPTKKTTFNFDKESGNDCANILKIDSRFVSLIKWLGEGHIKVRLSGINTQEGYCVYRIREVAFGGGTRLSAEGNTIEEKIIALHQTKKNMADALLEGGDVSAAMSREEMIELLKEL